MLLEPVADDRECRHKAVGAADTDAEAERHVPESDAVNERGQAQPEAED
jgi:hypothetical protein